MPRFGSLFVYTHCTLATFVYLKMDLPETSMQRGVTRSRLKYRTNKPYYASIAELKQAHRLLYKKKSACSIRASRLAHGKFKVLEAIYRERMGAKIDTMQELTKFWFALSLQAPSQTEWAVTLTANVALQGKHEGRESFSVFYGQDYSQQVSASAWPLANTFKVKEVSDLSRLPLQAEEADIMSIVSEQFVDGESGVSVHHVGG